MVITQPTIDNFSDTTVMRVIRKIVNYICSDSGLVAQINDNDITGFTSSYEDNVLKIDATKGDGSKLPVCNVTIEGGGSSTGNPYPTAVSGTVGVDGNIKFTITMSSGSPLTTTINMSYFASTADLSDLQKQVTEIKPTVTTNLESSPPTISVAVNGTTSTANLPNGGDGWEELDLENLPTDFANNDEIQLWIKRFAYINPAPSAWSSKMSGENREYNLLHPIPVNFILASSNEGLNASIPYCLSSSTGFISISNIQPASIYSWNTEGNIKISFNYITFNGSDRKYTSIDVRDNLSEYIAKMYRKKH